MWEQIFPFPPESLFEGLQVGAMIGLALALTFILIMGTLTFLYWIAECNRFITTVNEGTAKAVIKFNGFYKCLLRFGIFDFRINVEDPSKSYEAQPYEEIAEIRREKHDPWDVVMPIGSQEQREKRPSRRESLMRGILPRGIDLGGLRWVGLWPVYQIYEYQTGQVHLDSEQGVHYAPESRDSVRVQEDLYTFLAFWLKTKDLVPVAIEVVMTVAVVNPRKALFAAHQWLEHVQKQIQPALREYIMNYEYEELAAKSTASRGREFKKALQEPSGEDMDDGENERGILTRIIEDYGVSIPRIQLSSISPAEEYLDTTLQHYIGEQEAKRIHAVNTAIAEYGELGRQMAGLKALEKTDSNITLVGQGSGSGGIIPVANVLGTGKDPGSKEGSDHKIHKKEPNQ